MNSFIPLTSYSLKAVSVIVATAGVGVVLTKTRVLGEESLKTLSRLVFAVALPCLLFTKVARTVDPGRLVEWWILPPTSVLYVAAGIACGLLVVRVFPSGKGFRRGVVAATAFGNSSYIPIPLLVAATAIFPIFSHRSDEAAREAIAYVSVYLICFSPLMWTVGYALLSGRSFGQLRVRHLITPPLVGMGLGVLTGVVPPLKSLLCEPEGLLSPLFMAAELVAGMTIPGALIVLGGKFATKPKGGLDDRGAIVGIILGKLLLMPALAIAYVAVLRGAGLLPDSPLLALVLIIEAGTPPATNLVVMCSLFGRGDAERMARIQFWTYLAAIVTLTIWVMIALSIFA